MLTTTTVSTSSASGVLQQSSSIAQPHTRPSILPGTGQPASSKLVSRSTPPASVPQSQFSGLSSLENTIRFSSLMRSQSRGRIGILPTLVRMATPIRCTVAPVARLACRALLWVGNIRVLMYWSRLIRYGMRREGGWKLTLRLVRRWRSSCRKL